MTLPKHPIARDRVFSFLFFLPNHGENTSVSYNASMNRRTLFFILLMGLGLVIALFQFLANEYYLYWMWWWADVVMHFLGGLFVAGGILWWLRYEVPIKIRALLPVFLTTFVLLLIVGVAWEVFEFVTDSYGALNYVRDAGMDIAMDIVGMLVAYLIFKKYAH